MPTASASPDGHTGIAGVMAVAVAEAVRGNFDGAGRASRSPDRGEQLLARARLLPDNPRERGTGWRAERVENDYFNNGFDSINAG